MPLSDVARYDGRDLPRCPESSELADDNVNPSRVPGRWECALPVGHADFDDDRVREHSWVKVD